MRNRGSESQAVQHFFAAVEVLRQLHKSSADMKLWNPSHDNFEFLKDEAMSEVRDLLGEIPGSTGLLFPRPHQYLAARKCSIASIRGLTSLQRHQPNLKTLDLSRCSMGEDASP